MNGPNSCSILYILQPWGTSSTATDTNKTKQAHVTCGCMPNHVDIDISDQWSNNGSTGSRYVA